MLPPFFSKVARQTLKKLFQTGQINVFVLRYIILSYISKKLAFPRKKNIHVSAKNFCREAVTV